MGSVMLRLMVRLSESVTLTSDAVTAPERQNKSKHDQKRVHSAIASLEVYA